MGDNYVTMLKYTVGSKATPSQITMAGGRGRVATERKILNFV